MVCGCSFSAPSLLPEYQNTSWSEILAEKLNWDLINLARQGSSNGGIRIQIQEVIKSRPDFAIISATNHDRIEIPASCMKSNTFFWNWKKISKDMHDIFRSEKDAKFDIKNGIKNINVDDDKFSLISETIFSLILNWKHPYRKKQISTSSVNAIKESMVHLYDSNWKKQTDEWLIVEGLMELYHEGIDFIFMTGLSVFDTDSYHIPPMIPTKHIITNHEDCITGFAYEKYGIKPNNHDNDPGYHTTPEGQIYIANRIYNIISNWKTKNE